MNITVNTLRQKLHILNEQGQRLLQRGNTMRKIKQSNICLQKHVILIAPLGIVGCVILSPFLLFSFFVMAPSVLLFCSAIALLVMSFSLFFGFLLNCCLVMFVFVSPCHILYHICFYTICRIQTYYKYIQSSPSSVYQYLRARMCEVLLQLVDILSDDIPQQRIDGRKCVGSCDSSELEDIEPDYRDRETKLYEALVNSPQKTGKDTFEPFPY